MAALHYTAFHAADDSYLQPVRDMRAATAPPKAVISDLADSRAPEARPLMPPAPPVKSLRSRLIDYAVWGAVVVLLVVSIRAVELGRLPLLFSNSENMRTFGASFLKPDFTNWKLYVAQMVLTLQIALWGTVLAIVLAIPLGPGGGAGTSRRCGSSSRCAACSTCSAPCRTSWSATIFLVAVGLGPFAGVLALAVNTGGVLGKLFSEAVEAIDPRPVEGVRATGAAPLHEVVWGVLPQVGPLWTSYALYRFESNARSATVLGLIGAGGHRPGPVRQPERLPVRPDGGHRHGHRRGGEPDRPPVPGVEGSAALAEGPPSCRTTASQPPCSPRQPCMQAGRAPDRWARRRRA